MSEETSAETDAAAESSEGSDKVVPQSEVDRVVKERLARERAKLQKQYEGYDDYRAKAEQFDKLNDEKKSEVQRLNDQAQAVIAERDSLLSDNASLQKQILRQRISAAKQLDPDLWDRVRGDTEEDITADVEALVEKFSVAPKRTGALRSGASAPDGATGKQRAAAALRGLRRD